LEIVEKITASEWQSPKIFLSGSIRGGRQLLEIYRFIYDSLEEAGAEVLTWHVVDPELEKTEMGMTEEEIYVRDMDLLSKSDALIAEVTVPSTGVGYEICRALVREIPVLCLYMPDAVVSAMILGNPNPQLEIKVYSDKATLKKFVTEFVPTL
jgi:nucleoside 2-deoxyribosyltransferase